MDTRSKREETAHNRRDVRKASDTLTPTMMVLERERDDGEEQEDDGPGKGEPEGEEEDDGFADEEDESPSGGGVEEFTKGLSFEFGGSTVTVITGVSAELLGVLCEDEGTTGLTQEKKFDDEETAVGDELNLQTNY